MQISLGFAAMSVAALTACAGPPPAGQPAASRGVMMTGSHLEQDPAMKDPALSLVYPGRGDDGGNDVRSLLTHTVWPFVQVTGSGR
jgi:hypothetical protein